MDAMNAAQSRESYYNELIKPLEAEKDLLLPMVESVMKTPSRASNAQTKALKEAVGAGDDRIKDVIKLITEGAGFLGIQHSIQEIPGKKYEKINSVIKLATTTSLEGQLIQYQRVAQNTPTSTTDSQEGR